MKNRVLRLALVVILVIAMVLTVAACGEKEAPPTVTPTPTPTPATPTPDAPTPTPSTPVTPKPPVKDTVADDFGISLEGFDGVYDTIFDEDNYDTFAYGYFILKLDADMFENEGYGLTIDAGNQNLITVDDDEITLNEGILDTRNFEYDGDNDSDDFATGEKPVYIRPFLDEDGEEVAGEYIIGLLAAGEYELELEVVVTDEYDDYGAWNNEDKPEYDFTLEAVAAVAKKEVTVTPDPIVVKSSDEELYLDPADGKTVVTGDSLVDISSTSDHILYSAFEDFDLDDDKINSTESFDLAYSMDYIKEAKVGEYNVEVTLEEGGDDIDVEDAEFKNNIVSLADTKVYVISGQDWAEIRDVITSIAEIGFEGDEFDGNYETQLPIAKERYEALTDEQKAFFTAGELEDVVDNVHLVTTYTTAWNLAQAEDDREDFAKAEAYKVYMEKADEAVIDAAAVSAFNDIVDDSGIPDTAEKFSNENSGHVSGYNKIKDYFDALSGDDQDAIETDNGAEYQLYQNAKDEMDLLGINAVKELIVGAFQAYADAIDAIAGDDYYEDVVFQDGTAWAYINSAEVKSLTAQAKAAYDELSDGQKDVLDVSDGTEGRIDSLTITGGVKVSTIDETKEYKDALDKLTDMNAIIDDMMQVAAYINVEDYSDDDVPHGRLRNLIYGGDTGAKAGWFFPGYDNDDETDDFRYAMKDIINAEPRVIEDVIEQYKLWIDYVLAIETFKEGLVDTFEAGVTAFFDDNAEDYTGSVINQALAFDGNAAEMIINAIMNETALADIPAAGIRDRAIDIDREFGNGNLFCLSNFDLEDFETVAELEAEFADIMDIDTIVEEYCDAFEQKDAL